MAVNIDPQFERGIMKNVWRFGVLGFLGFLSFFPQLGERYAGLFGLFGLYGLYPQKIKQKSSWETIVCFFISIPLLSSLFLYGILNEQIFLAAIFFFTVALATVAGYSAILYYKQNKAMDIWKLGIFGFLGILGIAPGFGDPIYYFIYFYFIFFIFRKRYFEKALLK